MILVDSSFFVGLADAKDRWHADALRLRPRLRREPVVSDLCLAEAATILGKRKGGKALTHIWFPRHGVHDVAFPIR